MARQIYLVQYNGDKTVFNIVPTEIVGGENGATVYRIEAPFSIDNYSCGIDFLLANGEQPTRKSADFVSTVNVDVNGDPQIWYRYEYVFGNDVTVVSSPDATTILKATVVFEDKLIIDNNERMEIVDITIKQNVDANIPTLPVNDVARLDGRIDELVANKRDRNPSALTEKTIPSPEDLFTNHDEVAGVEKKIRFDDLKSAINESVILPIAYSTNTDSEIDDPVAGFGNFFDLVTDPSQVPAETIINQTPAIANVFEPVVSNIYPLGFFNGDLINTEFTTRITAKVSTGTAEIRIDYFKVTDIDLTGTLIKTGTPFLINTLTFNPFNLVDTITADVNINPNIMERVVSRVYVRSIGSVNTISAKIGGDDNSFTSWKFPSGVFSATKKDKNFGAVGDRLVKTKTDGNDEETEIEITDVARLSQGQTFTGLNIFNALVDFVNNAIVRGDLTIEGDLLVQGDSSQLETAIIEMEDLIPEFAKGNPSDILDHGIIWEQATTNSQLINKASTDKRWRLGLIGAEKLIALVQDGASNNIAVYNPTTNLMETQNPTQIKALLDIEVADVKDGADTPLQDLLDAKLENIPISENGTPKGAFTSMDMLGGVTVTVSNGVAFVDIIGEGLGEGLINIGSFEFVEIAGIPVSETLWNIETITAQSSDTDTFEILDSTDATDPSTVKVNKTKSASGISPVRYKFGTNSVLVNNDFVAEQTVTFIIKKDGTPISTINYTIPAASGPGAPNRLPVPLVGFVTTDIINDVEKYTTHIQSTSLLVDIETPSTTVETLYTIGEAFLDFMRMTVYDANDNAKVDFAEVADRTTLNVLVADTNADFKINNIHVVADNYYVRFKIPVTADVSNARFSEDDGVGYFEVLDGDGITNLIGTDISDTEQLYFFDGTNYILQVPIINAEDVVYDNASSGLNADNVKDAIDEVNIKSEAPSSLAIQNSTNIARLEQSVDTQDLDGAFHKDYITLEANEIATEPYSASISGDLVSTDTVILVDNTNGIVAGKELTVQDTLSPTNREYVIVQSVVEDTSITITSGLVNSYTVANNATIYSTTGPAPQWAIDEQMDVLPTAFTKAGPSGGATETIVSNRLRLNGLASGSLISYTSNAGTIVPGVLKRFESPIQVASSIGITTSPSQSILIGDGTRRAIVFWEEDKISWSDGTVQLAYTIDLQTNPHLIKIEVDNTKGLEIFVDNVSVFTKAYALLESNANNSMLWGDISGSAGNGSADVYYNFVKWQPDVTNNPDIVLFPDVYDIREKITSNNGVEIDSITDIEQVEQVATTTVDKALSVANDDNEAFEVLIEDDNLEYDKGVDTFRHYRGKHTSQGTNVFVRTTVTKNDGADTHVRKKQYGTVYKN